MRQETKTKVNYSEVNDKGETKYYITSETAWNKILSKAKEANESPLPDLVSMGTFGYSFPETVEEAVQLAGGSVTTPGEYENLDVFISRIVYSFSLAQDNEANDLLQSDNFEPFEGVKDVSYAISQKAERAKMTPQERAIKDLAKGGISVTPEQLMAALKLIQEQSAAASA